MGTVFEVEDRADGGRVALKLLRSVGPESIARFKLEFRSLQDLTHPNLVRLGELFESDGRWFFTMELVDGKDFLEHVSADVPALHATAAALTDTMPAGDARFDERRLREALAQLADGLLALHMSGRIHRDIKPSNIRVTGDGRVVLLDFGLVAHLDGDRRTTDSNIVGTAQYMAPEQAAAERPQAAADWYAVGATLFEVLTGMAPFQGPTLKVLLEKQSREPPPPRTLSPGVPDDLDDLCTRLLRRDPSVRASGLDVLRVVRGPQRPVTPSASQTMPQIFVGREAQLSELRSALARAREGHAVVVGIQGESGMGKSTLAKTFSDAAVSEHARVVALFGRCYEREAVPYKGLDGVLEGLARHLRALDQVDVALLLGPDAGMLARVFPSLSRVPALRRAAETSPPGDNTGEIRPRVFAALRDLLKRLTATSVFLITIDDIQWADVDSHALLRELLQGDDPPHMLVLLTRRPEKGPSARRLDLGRAETTLELTGLNAEESTRLIEALLVGKKIPDGLSAHDLAREADGHPLFIAELVRFAAAHGGANPHVRVDEVLLARSQDLDLDSRSLLNTIVVAGAPIRLGLAAAAAGLSPERARHVERELRSGTLIRGATQGYVEAFHDRVREAVYGALSPGERQAAHARLADVINEASGDDRDMHALVRHFSAAGEGKRAAEAAVHAAALAVESLAFDRAAELYSIALAAHDSSSEIAVDLRQKLAHAYAGAGRTTEAAEAFLSAAAASTTGAQRLVLRRRAAEQFLIAGRLDRGLAEMRAILQDIGLRIPVSSVSTIVSLLWNRMVLRLRGFRWAPRTVDDIAPNVLEKLEVHEALVMGISFVDNVRGAACHAKGLRLALTVGEPSHVARSLALEAVHRGVEGAPARRHIERLLAEAGRIATEAGDRHLEGYVLGSAGAAHYCIGEFAMAVQEFDAAEDKWTNLAGITWERNHVRLVRMLALRHMGCFQRLTVDFDVHVLDARQRHDLFAETSIVRAANSIWLARDDPDRAVAEVDRTSWLALPGSTANIQHIYEMRARAEAALYGSSGHDVRRLFEGALAQIEKSLLMRGQSLRADFRWLMGRCALAEHARWPRPALANEVRRRARQLSREDAHYPRVWGTLLTSGLALQLGETSQARAHFEKARALAKEGGLLVCEAVAKRRLGEIDGGNDGAALVRAADADMSAQGIVSPVRFAAMLSP